MEAIDSFLVPLSFACESQPEGNFFSRISYTILDTSDSDDKLSPGDVALLQVGKSKKKRGAVK